MKSPQLKVTANDAKVHINPGDKNPFDFRKFARDTLSDNARLLSAINARQATVNKITSIEKFNALFDENGIAKTPEGNGQCPFGVQYQRLLDPEKGVPTRQSVILSSILFDGGKYVWDNAHNIIKNIDPTEPENELVLTEILTSLHTIFDPASGPLAPDIILEIKKAQYIEDTIQKKFPSAQTPEIKRQLMELPLDLLQSENINVMRIETATTVTEIIGDTAQPEAGMLHIVQTGSESATSVFAPAAIGLHSVPIIGEFIRGLYYANKSWRASKNPNILARKTSIASGIFGATISFGSAIISTLWLAQVGLLATAAGFTIAPLVVAAGVVAVYCATLARDSYEIHQLRRKISHISHPETKQKLLAMRNSKIANLFGLSAVVVGTSLIFAGLVAASFFTGGAILPLIGSACIVASITGQLIHKGYQKWKARNNNTQNKDNPINDQAIAEENQNYDRPGNECKISNSPSTSARVLRTLRDVHDGNPQVLNDEKYDEESRSFAQMDHRDHRNRDFSCAPVKPIFQQRFSRTFSAESKESVDTHSNTLTSPQWSPQQIR